VQTPHRNRAGGVGRGWVDKFLEYFDGVLTGMLTPFYRPSNYERELRELKRGKYHGKRYEQVDGERTS
jgi:hypothetical protein